MVPNTTKTDELHGRTKVIAAVQGPESFDPMNLHLGKAQVLTITTEDLVMGIMVEATFT